MGRERKTTYTSEVGMEIANLIVENKTLRQIAEIEGMPCVSTIMKWRVDVPEFEQIYMKARQIHAHLLFEETLDIADDARNDFMEELDEDSKRSYKVNGEIVARSRLRIETRKFYISKILPKLYGDKIDLNVGGQSENPMVVEHKFDIDAVKARVQDVLGSTGS